MRVLMFVAALLLAACASPETSRSRGQGAGADLGNRRQVVQLHEGADPYYKTPRLIAQVEPADERHAARR